MTEQHSLTFLTMCVCASASYEKKELPLQPLPEDDPRTKQTELKLCFQVRLFL